MLVFKKKITAKSEGQPIILALSDIEQGFLPKFSSQVLQKSSRKPLFGILILLYI